METPYVDVSAVIDYSNVDCLISPTSNTFIGSGDINIHSDVAVLSLALLSTYNKCNHSWYLTANSLQDQQWLVGDISISDIAVSLAEANIPSTFAGPISGSVVFGGVTTAITVYYDTSIGIVYVMIQFLYTNANLNMDANLLYSKECTNNMKASGTQRTTVLVPTLTLIYNRKRNNCNYWDR